MNILTFLLKNWKIAIAVLIIGALIFFANGYFERGKTNVRLESNLANVTQDDANLTLTVGEYGKIHTKDTEKLDSVLKANKIKPSQIAQATVISSNYVDTNKVTANTGTPVILPLIRIEDNNYNPSVRPYSIPVWQKDSCWGMEGEIITTDINAKLNILKKTANNSNQLIVVKAKYFLFIRLHKQEFKLFTDCGESTFTEIKFVK
jgi:hypothetical protein